MVDYLYKRDYTVYALDPESREPLQYIAAHAQVNGIADYYDIPDLRLLALNKMKNALAHCWARHPDLTAKCFPDIVEKAVNSTGDTNLLDILAGMAAKYIGPLASLSDRGLNETMMVRMLRHSNDKALHFQAAILAKTSEALATMKDTQETVVRAGILNPTMRKGVRAQFRALKRG